MLSHVVLVLLSRSISFAIWLYLNGMSHGTSEPSGSSTTGGVDGPVSSSYPKRPNAGVILQAAPVEVAALTPGSPVSADPALP